MDRSVFVSALALVSGVIASSTVFAATLRVPADAATIQAAIDAAEPGDTVLVSRGVYYENLDFNGKAIALIGELGASRTVIDGGFNDAVIRMDSGEGPDALVRGFTLRRGWTAVQLLATSPVLRDNIFTENTHGSFGVAITGNNASPLVEGNVFVGNACDSQHLSGVLSFVNGSSPRIVNNVIHDNDCRAINMTVPVGAAPVVFNNTIVRNAVGIYVDDRVSTAGHTYRNNLIAANGVGLHGAYSLGQFQAVWTHNIVSTNLVQFEGMADLNGVDGNLATAPEFVDPVYDDFRLLPGSPGIDAGNAFGLPLPTTDVRGIPRIADGDGDGTSIVDIGAFELPAEEAIFNAGFEVPAVLP